ncbi:MAG: YidC/Oxa1 family insertase periplasmic-domain containing protein, partial [Kiritimatiellae bacterium]|nr:YidC/Oxa1 family insertase periplasmic-domain containing protein [Kiritimatiellia bacterium]
EVKITDEFPADGVPAGENAMSLGAMAMGAGKDDILSVDSWAAGADGGAVVHHGDDDSPLKPLLAGMLAGGGCGACGAPRQAAGMPLSQTVAIQGPQNWIALKNRFFATALASSTQGNAGFRALVRRNAASAAYRPESVSAQAVFAGGVQRRESVFFIGPKKLSLLWRLGLRDVMEFGMWRWICYPVVWLLVAFHGVAPSYGLAIILLTILVRLVFWPLTRKSTEGMKKMQEIQPLVKEMQAKYKDNPQRLQQETWALYRERKVNPLSSCLPMFVQIPVFIALFNVLRSAVELRYAGFLWIADLSAPEGLFPSVFPFGGLNILPLAMAATMFLQSKLTPTAGDQSQQRMMTVFMPLMMLVMFYNFASALSLYWTVSQCLSIVQMWMIRRQSAVAAAGAAEGASRAPVTRQMRRHS